MKIDRVVKLLRKSILKGNRTPVSGVRGQKHLIIIKTGAIVSFQQSLYLNSLTHFVEFILHQGMDPERHFY